MADTKISALPASTIPLAGTEVLPIVQSGVTKQVSVADLTEGRTQISNGVIQGTAATGYDFTANTPAGGATSQLLNWYEEGIWTATLVGSAVAGSSPNANTAYYTRVGRQVTVTATWFNTTVSGAVGTFQINGLPFTSANVAFAYSVGVFGGAVAYYTQALDNKTFLITNAPVVNSAGQYIVITHTYLV